MNLANIYEMIERGKPRMHATGFAQLYLADGVRLHVWSDYLFERAPDVSQVAFYHDHRYGIKSHVLSGALLDTPAEPAFPDPGNDGWQLWEVRPAHQGEPEKPHLASDYRYACVVGNPRIVKAGDGYYIQKRGFHATRHLGPTVTVMRKMEEEDGWARLLVPAQGFDPVHSLIRQPDVKVISALMWKECIHLPQGALDKIEEMMTEAYRAH